MVITHLYMYYVYSLGKLQNLEN